MNVKCKSCGNEFDYDSVPESGMGYVRCPQCSQPVTQSDKKEIIDERILGSIS